LTTPRATKRATKSPSKSAATKSAPAKRLTTTATQRRARGTVARARGGSSSTGGADSSTGHGGGASNGNGNHVQPPESRDRARALAMAIAEVGLEYKALNIEIIDVRGKVDYSDYVVVMSGRSDRQVNALGRHIEEELKNKLKARCLGVEGMPSGTWLLMDYSDVVVHIFHEDTRGYYDLETLWIDAARVATDVS
jgi:ribosome-associated protein